MNIDIIQSPIRGVITPLITPFTTAGKIDYGALEMLIDRVVAGGVSGVFVLGTTGEGPCLLLEDRKEIIKRVIDRVSGRVPVQIGATDVVYSHTMELIRFAERAGADAVVVTPPPYFSCSQDELIKYFERLAARVELPWLLYNIPSLTKTSILPQTMAKVGTLPLVAGIKDSSGDLGFFGSLLDAARGMENFPAYIGPENHLVEALALGAHGGVHGGSNLFPSLYVDLFRAVEAGDSGRVRLLDGLVRRICNELYSLSPYENACIRVVKFLLSELGLCTDRMVEPFEGLSKDAKAKALTRFEALLPDLEAAGITLQSLARSSG